MDTSMERGQSSSPEWGAKCWRLSVSEIEHYWGMFEKALDADPELWRHIFTKEGVRDAAKRGEIQIWVVAEDDTITLALMSHAYTPESGVRRFQVFWAYGMGLPKYLPLLDTALDRFAAKGDCGAVEIIGRKGFERMLAPLGFEYQCSVFTRPVRHSKGN